MLKRTKKSITIKLYDKNEINDDTYILTIITTGKAVYQNAMNNSSAGIESSLNGPMKVLKYQASSLKICKQYSLTYRTDQLTEHGSSMIGSA